MIKKYYFRKYGNLESLVQKLNGNIVYLNSYIKNKKDEVTEDSTIESLNDLLTKLNNPKTIELEYPFSLSFCNEIKDVAKAINYCTRDDKCSEIESAWRTSRDTCKELKKTVDDMAKAINALGDNPKDAPIVGNKTKICQFVRICKHDDFYPLNQLDEQKLKSILNPTIEETYKTNCRSRIVTGLLLTIGIIAFILFGCCSCKKNTEYNRNIDRISVSIVKEGDKTTFFYSSCDSVTISVEKVDSIIVERENDACEAFPIHVIMKMDSCRVKDSVVCLNTKYVQKVNDTTFNNVTIFQPHKNNCLENPSRERNEGSIQMFLLIKWFLLFITFTLILIFVVRPLATKLIDNESKQNENILNDKLRVQNEWQQILQDRYRLENRRIEIDLNAIEKESKIDIDEQVKAKEHQRQMELKEKEIDLEKTRIYSASQNAANQMYDKRLRELNEQIVKLMSNDNK